MSYRSGAVMVRFHRHKLLALILVAIGLLSWLSPASAAPPAQCLAGNSPTTSSPYVVCSADSTSAWISANNDGTYYPLAICQALGYATVTAYGGTCGNVCGYCEGSTSCSSHGSETFDGSGAPSLASLNSGGGLAYTVHWKCGGNNPAAVPNADKTVVAIHKFISRRNDLIATNGPNMSRQIDRLERSNGSGVGAQAGLASKAPVQFVENSANGGPKNAGGRTATNGVDAIASTVIAASDGANGDAVQGAAGGGSPFGVAQAEPRDADSAPVGTFQTSLAQMRDAADQADARRIRAAFGNDSMMALGHSPSSNRVRPPTAVDIWAEGHFARFSDDRGGYGSDGRFGIIYLGADYVVSPGLLVGALVQYDNMDMRSSAASVVVEGHGWMAGPYATLKLTDNVYLQGRAAWGTSNNEVSPLMTYTDHFDSQRWLVAGKLSGHWQFGPWQFRPSASIDYIEDKTGAYTDSVGALVPSVKATLGQLRFGPEFGYRFGAGDGTTVEPRIGVIGVWNFESSGSASDFGGTLAGPEELRGRVEIGVMLRAPSGVSLDLTGSYDGIGTGSYEAYTGSAVLRIPLN